MDILKITLAYTNIIATPSIQSPKSRRLLNQLYIEEPNLPDHVGAPSVNAAEYIEKKSMAIEI